MNILGSSTTKSLRPTTTNTAPPKYKTAADVISEFAPAEPVYCFHRHIAHTFAKAYLEDFPGDVLYAVKANPCLPLLDALYEAGVRHFDTASLPEIHRIKTRFPDAHCYFMAPVRFLGASAEAYNTYGVRDFVFDSDEELEKILRETNNAKDLTLYVRLKTDVGGAVLELSSKFGTYETDAVRLLKRVAETGCRPALAFHVGSLCLDAHAFSRAMKICKNVIKLADVEIAALDVGGGFPAPYVGSTTPPLTEYFQNIRTAVSGLGLKPGTRILCEPGRGLSAHAFSLITNVIGRNGDRIFINDGVYGNFAETLIPNSRIIFPTRCYRIENGQAHVFDAEHRAFTIYGPTCDSLDVLPYTLELPTNIQTGDFIEFGLIGAYSYANRTDFNGFLPEAMVELTDNASLPPGVNLNSL